MDVKMYEMRKIHKRFFVIDDNGAKIYTMPDYMTGLLRSRQEFQEKIVDRLNQGDNYSKVILDFHEEIWNRRLVRTHPHMFGDN